MFSDSFFEQMFNSQMKNLQNIYNNDTLNSQMIDKILTVEINKRRVNHA